jgi:hypothetical protein
MTAINAPTPTTAASIAQLSRTGGVKAVSVDSWYREWHEFLQSSFSFRQFLVSRVIPILRKQPLLAFPEDARLRDMFSAVFSVEVLVVAEQMLQPLTVFLERVPAICAQYAALASGGTGVETAASTGSGRARGGPVVSTTITPSASPQWSSSSNQEEQQLNAMLVVLRRSGLVPGAVSEAQVRTPLIVCRVVNYRLLRVRTIRHFSSDVAVSIVLDIAVFLVACALFICVMTAPIIRVIYVLMSSAL